MDYAKRIKKDPVKKAVKKEKGYVENNTGGFVHVVSRDVQLRRFLIIGSEGGTYYVGEKKLTKENAKNIRKMIENGGAKNVIDSAVEVSDKGLALWNDPAIFALALVMTHGTTEDKIYAVEKASKIIRTGTHQLTLASYLKDMRGYGRSVREILNGFYINNTPAKTAYQCVKYQNRNGFTHRDIFRLTHIKPTEEFDSLFKWVVKGEKDKAIKDFPIIEGFEKAKMAKTESEISLLIHDFRLEREMIPSEFLNKPKVQEALLCNMKLHAILRNLAGFTASGFLTEANFSALQYIEDQFTEENIKKSRMHPIAILDAMNIYSSGHGMKGSLVWRPIKRIVNMLDDAFYTAFHSVETTGKRIMMALDISGSMTSGNTMGTSLTPRQISAAMAMVTFQKERNIIIKGFSSGLIDMDFGRKDSLESVMGYINSLSAVYTNIGLPIEYALKARIPIDTFIIYTDSEVNSGRKPDQLIREYRKQMGMPDTKFIVCATTATKYSVADPDDPNMLDVCGFSSDTPQVLGGFMKGEI